MNIRYPIYEGVYRILTYDEIKNYLNVIAPEVSIASYISNIIAEHIELNIEEITRMYKDRFSPPKIQ